MPRRVSSTAKRWISFISAALSAGRRPVDAPMRVTWPIPWPMRPPRRFRVEAVVVDERGDPGAPELGQLLGEGHPPEQLVDVRAGHRRDSTERI